MKQQVRNRVIPVLIASILSPVAIYSQTLNPAYLAEMPVSAKVLAGITGKDAEDTGERQMGAFMSLIDIMDQMAWGIGHRYVNNADTRALTPDERRIRLAYQTAYADLWHKVTNKEDHKYDHDRDLRNELLGKFFPESFRALYFQSNKNAMAAYKAFHDKMYANPAAAASTQPGTQTGSPGSQTAAPGSRTELRRCIASGRSMRICFSESLGNGFSQLFGMNLNQPQTPSPPGLRMTGDYASADGFRLIFEPEQVTMVCRGVPAPKPYTVRITDTQTLVTLQHDSKPVVFALRPDGKLAGSGPIRVTGLVPSGSHSEQTMGTTRQKTTTTRELTPLEARNYPNATANGQVYTVKEDASQLVYGPAGSRTVTDFTTKSADCTIGLLSPIGGSPLPTLPKNDFEILTTIGAGMGALMKGGDAKAATNEMLFPDAGKTIAPGLRMSGSYASQTGFNLNFHSDSVTVACGDSERALEYSIQHAGNKTTLVVKDDSNPTSLQLMPDGSITGEGTVQVNGRIITGTTEDLNNPFVFAPHVAGCPVGRLVAGAPITMPVSVAPSPTPSSPASAGGASGALPSGAPQGGASLKIAAAQSVASRLAGKALIVLKDDPENLMASAGISAQGASSRVSAWSKSCERPAQEAICKQGAASIASSIVARTGFDVQGIAAFNNVPSSGTFYILADTSSTNHLIWSVKVDLKPGANSFTLDERNATPVGR